MKEAENQLKEIRGLMERSTKFLSLSGYSGIWIGILALVAAFICQKMAYWEAFPENAQEASLLLLSTCTALCALLIAIYFTYDNVRKSGEKLWGRVSRRLVLHLSIPLATGAFVLLYLLFKGLWWPLPGFSLLFYGLALCQAYHFSYKELLYLGLAQISLGLFALIYPEWALEIWALGFGVLHIFYGFRMLKKYESK